ncbi:Esterase FE4 [Orchesella cincta]|uniref:Esterase FE4 n=1 Tax=Orchesella cincta TaxID=48709 RepID=A0A1D2N7T3_ORCCI|nr:Esterase FE4 [Orchesella cincta]
MVVYQHPDTRPSESKKEESDLSSEAIFRSDTAKYLQRLLHDNKDLLKQFQQQHSEATNIHTHVNSYDCGDEVPFVTTKAGIVEGYRIQVVGGRKVCAFEGIPYAESPTGYLRFRSPIPKKNWKGILRATQYPPACLQYNVPEALRTVGQEDCLYLNVYTPQISEPGKFSVIVFIHGGGYFFGSTATYGPTYLLQKNVVLVTIQYRLGVMGFLSTGDSVCPGQQKNFDIGMTICNSAFLKLGVKRGDPNRVTIMGQSAGSAAVHLHMLSQSTRRYFRNAISLSGTAFNYWSFFDQYQTRNITNTFAKRLGCPTHDSTELVECIRQLNPVDVVSLTPQFLDDWPYPSNAFRPSIEVTEGNPDAFLTDYPENIYRRNEVANVPWIVSTVSGEGYAFLLFPFITFAFSMLQRNWYKLALDLVDAENLDIDGDKLVKRLTRYYFRDQPPEKTPIRTYAQIVTDRMFTTGIYEAAKAHVQVAPTYSYFFDFNGQYNQIVNYGYPASEWDVFYLFNASRIYSGFKRGDPEYEISRILVNLITNFADKGVPLLTDSNGEDVEIWKPHDDPQNLNYLGISQFIGMIGDPFKKRMNFWRRLRLPDTPTNVLVAS